MRQRPRTILLFNAEGKVLRDCKRGVTSRHQFPSKEAVGLFPANQLESLCLSDSVTIWSSKIVPVGISSSFFIIEVACFSEVISLVQFSFLAQFIHIWPDFLVLFGIPAPRHSMKIQCRLPTKT